MDGLSSKILLLAGRSLFVPLERAGGLCQKQALRMSHSFRWILSGANCTLIQMNHQENHVDWPEDALELLTEFVTIPGPTFQEDARARWLVDWLKANGVEQVEVDEIHNVTARFGEPGPEGWTWLDAHIDTVFPDQDLSVRVEGDKAYCPGIYDNGIAVLQLMLLARHFARQGGGEGFLISFSVGEEGEGDLCGMKALAGTFPVKEAVIFDCGLGKAMTSSVGSRRFEITFKGPAGHSWGNFGRPSAIHVAALWIVAMEDFMPWEKRVLSYNVGEIHGGQGVNVIAPECSLKLDLRSLQADELDQVPDRLRGLLEKVCGTSGVDFEVRELGFRPAGQIPAGNDDFIQMLDEVHRGLGIESDASRSSTNANWLYHKGIAALSSGLASGGLTHAQGEWLDLEASRKGWIKLQHLVDRLRERRTKSVAQSG